MAEMRFKADLFFREEEEWGATAVFTKYLPYAECCSRDFRYTRLIYFSQ